MPLLHDVVHHPRKLFLRRALFQIHLWAGILLSLYVVIIALTGAILVFEDELTATTLPARLSLYNPAQTASIPTVMAQFQRAYPGARVSDIDTPWPRIPAYRLRAVSATGHEFSLVADPVTAALQAQPETWVNWMHDLHVLLLLGSAHGEQVNGVGAAILLLLSVTGILLWWQGLKNWMRGLTVDLRRNWRRINFDAHHAIGFWTLAIVLWWSISGVYFGWYKQFGSIVNAISPLQGMAPPPLPAPLSSGSQRASLAEVLAAVQRASPQGRLFSISDPSLSGTLVYAQMDLRAPADFSHRDIVAIDTTNARVLSIWHYGQNRSAGDWFMWCMHPLHFGTLWGFGFKVTWFVLGLSLAVLSATGVIMYWNRYLRHHI
ncbi:MAG: PepSY-associated TM helix domain-containing protein [Terracidiphilus sp.]